MAEKKRYYRKNTELSLLVSKIKLWPAKSGVLHGVREVEASGKLVMITTHCGETFRVYDSRTSRAARWLRNKWISEPCRKCKVPQWKLDKYSKTYFSQHYGSNLKNKED